MLRNVAIFFLRHNLKHAKHKAIRTCVARFSSATTSNAVAGTYLYDENNENNVKNNQTSNKFTERTHTCGELRAPNVGETVTLCGWLEYRRMGGKFAVLRDAYGQTQLLIKSDDTATQTLLKTLPLESVLKIKGTVVSRPPNMTNKNQATGEVEVLVEDCFVMNKAAEQLPFNIREFQKAHETKRIKYRYLDMRFAEMQRNLRVRSSVLMKMREFLVNQCGFVDVETPTLFRATPGGAQEFVVPTRFPGKFYSLVQSPQQLKQMLMAGGIDRYFQVARCYRDEGLQSDKQPEFTQLDIEMSFIDVEHVMKLIEELLQYCWPTFLNPLPAKFKRITYSEAMSNYGTDKPDTRFENKLQNCREILKSDVAAYCVVFPGGAAFLTESVKNALKTIGKEHTLTNFIQTRCTSQTKWDSALRKRFGDDASDGFLRAVDLKENDVLFVAFGDEKQSQLLLGRVRKEFAKHCNEKEKFGDSMHFLWVTDFPLFEKSDDGFSSTHHPFTAPHPDDLHLLETSPLEVRSLAYDLVLNGNEIGGGSMRIHDAALQENILEMLGIEKSGLLHMLEMLNSGCPSHGGIALGLDRLFAVMLNAASIRDVIAFPKTLDGKDLLSGAPAHISDKDKQLYHINVVEEKK